MRRQGVFFILLMVWAAIAQAQMEVRLETQSTTSDGDHTPLWLNANRYGLSSLEKTNGYVRAGLFRDEQQDSSRLLRWGMGVDVAATKGFTSDMVLQQAYGEVGFWKALLTVGSKEQPMELKNKELSTGSQTLGINARPVPSVRLSLPDYWTIPGTKGWIGVKGHLSYGVTTDDEWQRDFTDEQTRYTEHTWLHTKAGFMRVGKPGKPFSVELGLEMAAQFGGTSFLQTNSTELSSVKNESGLKGMWHALLPSGYESIEKDIEYKNIGGNHLGSWLVRVNYDTEGWGASIYADHFFEDQSQMFHLDFDGYGSGEEWNKWKDDDWLVYDLRDILLGAEMRFKHSRWVNNVVAEFMYTKYQSGPVYHDHTRHLSDHIGGNDNYYNHVVFTGWQHWGQVMGNPLYRSPLYNDDGRILVEDNRFWAWHLAVTGTPFDGWSYRVLSTWQRGFGTYDKPLVSPRRNMSFLAEVGYRFPETAMLAGWSVKGALGMDRGGLLGDNVGLQLTIGKTLKIER